MFLETKVAKKLKHGKCDNTDTFSKPVYITYLHSKQQRKVEDQWTNRLGHISQILGHLNYKQKQQQKMAIEMYATSKNRDC